MIGSGNCKLIQLIAVADFQALTGISKCQNNLRAVGFRFGEHRSRLCNLMTVSIGQCPTGHPLPNVELIPWVYVMSFADIDRHDQAGVGCCDSSSSLCLTNVAPSFVCRFGFWISIVRQLNNTEREITFTPTFAPGADHCWQQDAILLS